MKMSFTTLGLILLNVIIIPAQQPDKQYWSWYFSNQVALQFTSQSLPPVYNIGSAMSANEGASSISDTGGNILFYSDGQAVWNRLNQILPNGTGLEGHYWSSQSALILKLPGSDSLYYIFTVNNWTDASTELNYSIIDKSLSGGLGEVTAQKNILINDNCSEHLTAAYHDNGTDIWILSHEVGNNNFVAYLLTSSGLDTIPVVSAAGAIYSGANRYGYMRVSPYCNRIATALGKQTQMNIPDTTAQVFDFDNTTGIVSNAIFIADLTNLESAYCCEFSPDNSKVYFTEHNGMGVYQVDLDDPNPASTFTNISTTSTSVQSSLTLGPDNKIYITKSQSNSLAAINSPNLPGMLCDHNGFAVVLGMNLNSISTCNILKQCTQFTGVTEYENNLSECVLYPNPATGSVMISITGKSNKANCNGMLQLIDVTGRVKYTTEYPKSSNEQILDVRGFSRGMYLVRITTCDDVFIDKLILE